MAKNGRLNTNKLRNSSFYVSWQVISQNIEGNYTDIAWQAGLNTSNNDWWYTNAIKIHNVVIDGETVFSGGTYSNVFSDGDHQYASGTKRIYHSDNGTRKFGVSISGWLYSYGDTSNYDEFMLDNIPRASSVSGGSGNIGGSTIISITRASDSFTHTLEYAFGNLTGTIATGIATSHNWIIPASFYSQIPNSNSGTGTITCKTYSGSTLIGTKTCSFTANVVNSNPILGDFTYKDKNEITVAITENDQRIIRDNSNLVFEIGNAIAQNGAMISNYEVTINEITKSVIEAGELEFGTINLSNNTTAILKVIDSRGNSSIKEINIIIDDWILPTGLVTLNRKNNFYSETYLKVDGTYSSLNEKNLISIQYQYKKVSDNNYSILESLTDNVQKTLDLDNNNQWNIRVIIADKIGSTIYNLFLDRGMPIAYFDRLKTSVGINTFPIGDEEFAIKGKLLVNNQEISAGVSGDTLPIGTMVPYGNIEAPSNWLICDGSEVSRETYSSLFAVIGTSYGVGNGSTTFNLPNKKGKVSVGIDSSDIDFNTIGKIGGEKTHTLTIDEIPAHTHTTPYLTDGWKQDGSSGSYCIAGTTGNAYQTESAGGGQTHNNMPPYEVDCWIIKAFQSAGVVAKVSNTESTSTTDTYSCDYINKLNTYSKEEQVIGIDSNGNTWYRKFITITNITTTDWTEVSFSNLGLSEDISFLRIKWGSMERAQGIWEDFYSSGSRVQWVKNSKSLSFLLEMVPFGNIMIEVEYTKTTD